MNPYIPNNVGIKIEGELDINDVLLHSQNNFVHRIY